MWVGTKTRNILQTSYLRAAPLAGAVVEGAGAAVAHLQVELDVDHVGPRVDRLEGWIGGIQQKIICLSDFFFFFLLTVHSQ